MRRALAIVALSSLCYAVIVGCKGEGSLMEKMDEASVSRLEALADDSKVLLSVSFSRLPEEPLDLAEGTRRLGNSGDCLLFETPKPELLVMSELDGVEEIIVWGGGEATNKLDPRLRSALLRQLSAPEGRAEQLPMIAIFAEDSVEIERRLLEDGVQPRSVIGRVATLDASVDVVFNLLQLPDLMNLNQPDELRPVDRP